jgi:iron complex transport system substrate-binding protein
MLITHELLPELDRLGDQQIEQFVWAPESVEGVFDAMLALGKATGLEAHATEVVVSLRERMFRVSDFVNSYTTGPSVCVLESLEPLMVSGRWVSQLVERAGGEYELNPTRAMADAGAGAGGQQAHRVAGPPREITPGELQAANPDRLIFCLPHHEPDEARRKIRQWLANSWVGALDAVRDRRCVFIDGRMMLTEPGPSLVEAYEWLVGWINDRADLIPSDFPWEALGVSAV